MRDPGCVSRGGIGAERLEGLRDGVAGLIERIRDGEGVTSVAARRAAFNGQADDPAVARYLGIVRMHAYRVTDEDVERLRAAGLGDDAIFELTVAAALGAGVERLELGLSLLAPEA
jgi:hypothetical protein